MASSYDPFHDLALLLAAAMQTAGTQARTVTDPLMQIAGRLGFTYRTDPAGIEDALRGNVERRVRRETAREILHLDLVDRDLTRKAGPYGDMRTSLRRLERGEPLPDWRDLRGGEGAGHA